MKAEFSKSSVKKLYTKPAAETDSSRKYREADNWVDNALSDDHDGVMTVDRNGFPESEGTEYYCFRPIHSIGYWDDPEDDEIPFVSVATPIFSGIYKLLGFINFFDA